MGQLTSDTIMGPIIIGAGILCWIWAFIECRRDQSLEPENRKRWLLFIALIPGIGAFFYFMHRRALNRNN